MASSSGSVRNVRVRDIRPIRLGVVEGTTDDLTVVRAAGLATARYQDWRPAYRVPVRTTVGGRGKQVMEDLFRSKTV